MEIEILLFHLGVLIPMVYFIWKDGYNKGIKDGKVYRIRK